MVKAPDELMVGMVASFLTFLMFSIVLLLAFAPYHTATETEWTSQYSGEPVMAANSRYYCNLTFTLPENVYVQDYIYNETSHEVENITCAEAMPKFSFFTPAPTHTILNDTRRTPDGYPDETVPCCKTCTPTPTPTTMPVPEFPWLGIVAAGDEQR